MKYIDLNGDEGEVNVGGAVCGIGFTSVTITPKDTRHPDFWDWFKNIVQNRIAP